MIENTNETVLAKQTVNRIEEIAGKHPGYRRTHAKGEIYAAEFSPSGAAASFTTAEHLQNTDVKTIVRFSNISPNPSTPDQLSVIKGMSVQFQLPSGEISNLVGVTIPIFVTKSPQTFFKILNTVNSFKEGRPHFRDMVKLFASYPESRAAIKIVRKLENTKSYATAVYYTIHAFYLVNKEGYRVPVKFEWIPEAGIETWTVKEMVHLPNDYLEREVENRLETEEVKFRLEIVLGEPGDLTNDPTKEWPKARKRINAGILSIKGIATEVSDDIVFDPTVVARGIECSDDEILLFRKHAYTVSHERRSKGE